MEKITIFDITKSVLLIIIVLFLFFKFDSILTTFNGRNTGIQETRIEQIVNNAVAIQVAESKKDYEKLLSEMKNQNSIILESAKKDKGDIQELSKMYGELKGEIVKLGTTFTYTDTEVPERDLVSTQIELNSEGYKLPIGEVYYSPNIADDPWVFNPYPVNYHVDIVQTEGDTTHGRYVEMYANNKYSDDKYPVNIDPDNVTWVKKPIKDKKFFFPNFRLGMSGVMDMDSAYPSLNISTFSYGKTTNDMDFRFCSLGVGGNSEELLLYVSPFEYNVGKPIPLIDNLFIGPSYIYKIDNNIDDITNGVGLNLSLPF